ncbi:MAG: hypothetical protein KA956_11255 [Pyrinomonadaceae bacterium]|nr:hypothetical protein [Acidobacteriota bacterium]MBP7377043.1 hypothetical protein [Pyrinomonadaceae bacterium]
MMILFGFEIADVADWPLLAGISESAGVLVVGVSLISIAGIMRWALGRRNEEKHYADDSD